MDWLRFFIAFWTVLLLLSMIGNIFMIGQPRKPITAASVGCSFFITVPVFVLMLLVWQRLGTT